MPTDNLHKSSEPIRSVHLTNYYHPASGGVKANYDRLLLAANRRRRHVSLIVPGEESRVEKFGEFGKIYFVAAPSSPFVDRRYRLMMPWHYMLTDSPIRRILLDEKPRIVEVYDNYSLTFLAGMTRMGWFHKLDRPMFVYFTGERFDTIFKTFVAGGAFGNWFSRRFMGNFNLAMFDFFIANSPFVAEEILESVKKDHNPGRSDWFFEKCWKFLKASPRPFEDRVAICPRGVDTDMFSPNRRSAVIRRDICSEFGVPDDCVLLMSSTRLSPEKNIELLPKIVKILANEATDYRLLVAGAGPKEEWLREESIRTFPGKIVLTGHLDKSKLADLYANVDVFIHPNPREPFGNVGLEAMASGAAIVVPNSGGVLTYADEDNSWTVNADAASFAEAIKEAASNHKMRESKVENALCTARASSNDAAIDRLFETYDRMYKEFSRWQSTVINETNVRLPQSSSTLHG